MAGSSAVEMLGRVPLELLCRLVLSGCHAFCFCFCFVI